jgi:hypothetical protein
MAVVLIVTAVMAARGPRVAGGDKKHMEVSPCVRFSSL